MTVERQAKKAVDITSGLPLDHGQCIQTHNYKWKETQRRRMMFQMPVQRELVQPELQVAEILLRIQRTD
ncbi:hypothetical protein CEXT_546581 [Caerostris extrusa]|uniref:Uncharacterized protein n=1 Tax=Caerostris extrusa TaxID=172846 RepID=A0AAV4Y0C5_CAEEX|nr:hypothetical protein CEXT_546581 [Caerostris extrusa]